MKVITNSQNPRIFRYKRCDLFISRVLKCSIHLRVTLLWFIFFAPLRKKLMKYSMKFLSMPMQYNIITVKNRQNCSTAYTFELVIFT